MMTYSELILRDTFLSRFKYLALGGSVGIQTFGRDRPLNQMFYHSHEWKRMRDAVIVRDNGCDLGVPGHEIHDKILVHHMNPMQMGDILEFNPEILNPEYLICVTHNTHNAIHWADERRLPQPIVERRPGDHVPWRTT